MCVLALSAALSAACGTSVNVEQERTALMARDRDWAATTKDVDKFISFLAADAAVYPPGAPVVRGADAIRKEYSAMAAAPGFSLTWTPSSADVGSSGDLGYTSGAYEISGEKGKYITVWKRTGGTGNWMVAEDIFNPDGPPTSQHAVVSPDTIKWGDAPPSLPPGAKVAVVSGDPSQAAPFVIRAQMPAGYRIAPHWHPGVENVTVLAGTVAVGMGEKWDDAALKNLSVGGYATMPAEMRHFFTTRSAATIQVHGMGPFAVNYVNPADDPQKK
jgi:ketosteroid isomerase-like protein